MANSKFAYVKSFEEERKILPNCYFVLRIDGSNFKNFTKVHEYKKPNDKRGLELMSTCAIDVLNRYDEINICYGHSDEYSFVFNKNTKLWNRRYNKLLSNIVSYFTSCFIFNWSFYFDQKLMYPPSFDGRIIVYPTEKEIKDYLSWRQIDCHINTQYNECFWNLILKCDYTREQAYKSLLTTQAKHKNELLFSRFHINYNDIPQIFKRGTIIIRNKHHKQKLTPHCAHQFNDMSSKQSQFKHELIQEENTDDVVHAEGVVSPTGGDTPSNELPKDILHEQEENPDDVVHAEGVVSPTGGDTPSNELPKDILHEQEKEKWKKYIKTHENLVSDKFWEKYNFVFEKKGK
ncbi:tRNAHis guanylyltransferase, putative [Plasmodium ovale wallikeri]|uniref:tRNA(His) guanylyltransferase n=1 Tax=Plasmodium ovale wallikeri TaxID=864142 RepID=A0A1A8YKE8_PLAOA|nr:tRNAHis guanylyltransferase, putative [Plasmodium ovale wallikeri]SBT31977.1 tRNAHis guanylyltransferase, putative [Plasmodium ovale wallikeri]